MLQKFLAFFFLSENGSLRRKEILEVLEGKLQKEEIRRFWGERGKKWEIFSGKAQYYGTEEIWE